MFKILSKSCSGLCALLVVSLVLPSSPAVAQRRFQDTTDVVVVEIPVEVTRDGEPVRGLTPADFEVVDGRKRQEIVGFDVIDLQDPSRSRSADGTWREIPVAARRHFLMLFDLALSYPATVARARSAAQELVRNSLHPSDLVAVGVYTASQGAQLVLGFTSDRRQVDVAIETLALPQLIETRPDPLGLILADREAFPSMQSPLGGSGDVGGGGTPGSGGASIQDRLGGGGAGGLGEAHVREMIEMTQSAAGRADEKRTVLALTSSLGELASMMGSIEGRKHVVFLSEGFSSASLLGAGVSSADEQQLIQQQSAAAASGEVWKVDPDARFGNTNSLNQLEVMAQDFVRNDCTIQAVDIGGLRAGGDVRARRASDDGLYMMADKTGGDHYRNFNDLGAAMGKMLERTSVTYLLAIQPENLKRDGDYHRLKVKVDGKGLNVNHRPGYFAPRPFGEQSAQARRFATAGLVMGGRDGGLIDTAVLAPPFLVSADRAYVPVLLEIDGPSLLTGHHGNVLPTELYVYAIEEDGSVADYFTQTLGLDLSKAEEGLRRSGFKFWGFLEVPPGHYTVRSVVRNSSTGAYGVRTAEISVPRLDRNEAALLPPLVPEPVGKWLIGKQQGADDAGYPYPFVLGGQAFVPAARPVMHAQQASQISLVGYNLEQGELEVTAQLLDLEGRPAGSVQVALDARGAGAFSGQEQITARVLAPAVAAGRYTLEVTIGDASGGSQTSAIPVVIEG